MQAANVKIGQEYAFNHKGEKKRLKVTEQVTVRNHHGTSNSFNGVMFNDVTGTDGVEIKGIDTAAIIGPFADWKEGIEADKRAKAEKAAEQKRQEEQALKLANLLNALIGHEPYKKPPRGDYYYFDNRFDGAKPDYRAVKIPQEAVEALIAKLQK